MLLGLFQSTKLISDVLPDTLAMDSYQWGLKLEAQGGPSKGNGPSTTVTIVAPTDAYMTKVPGKSTVPTHLTSRYANI